MRHRTCFAMLAAAALCAVAGAYAAPPPSIDSGPPASCTVAAMDFGRVAPITLWVKIEKKDLPALEHFVEIACEKSPHSWPAAPFVDAPDLPDLCPPPVARAWIGAEVVSYELVHPLLRQRSCGPMGLALASSLNSGPEVPG